MTENTIRNVAFCPHCGNLAPQRLVHVQYFQAYGFHLDGRQTEFDYDAAYFVSVCETCQEILVYLAEAQIPEEERFADASLQWPDAGQLPRSVPEPVRNCYSEAARIRRIAPNAFAVQIRRALEALCEDRGELNGVLYSRLQALAHKGEIPPVLGEMTDVLRLLGNLGAHAAAQPVLPGHVRSIDEFFRAVVEYVYIAPAKIAAFKEQLDRSSQTTEVDNGA